jgi:hypothetical protein
MVEIATLATKAQAALRVLGTLPVETVREVRKAIAPIATGAGNLITSIAGSLDKLGHRAIVAPEKRKLTQLRTRLENDSVILSSQIAKSLLQFDARQRRSCIAFLHREVKAVNLEFKAQMHFFQSWKDSILRNSSAGLYRDTAILLQDLAIVNDLMRFEILLYKRTRIGLLKTLEQAHGRSDVSVARLVQIRSRIPVATGA